MIIKALKINDISQEKYEDTKRKKTEDISQKRPIFKEWEKEKEELLRKINSNKEKKKSKKAW